MSAYGCPRTFLPPRRTLPQRAATAAVLLGDGTERGSDAWEPALPLLLTRSAEEAPCGASRRHRPRCGAAEIHKGQRTEASTEASGGRHQNLRGAQVRRRAQAGTTGVARRRWCRHRTIERGAAYSRHGPFGNGDQRKVARGFPRVTPEAVATPHHAPPLVRAGLGAQGKLCQAKSSQFKLSQVTRRGSSSVGQPQERKIGARRFARLKLLHRF